MPGAGVVQDQVETMIDVAMSNAARRKAGLPEEPVSFNMMLLGNPGTGKTTLARKMGELMFELGLVKSPEVAKLSRQDLHGTYTNHVSRNTEEAIKRNRGKVIFIDEAYSLVQGHGDHIGKEALTKMMELVEEYRDDTVLVLAGYEHATKELLTYNPGMASRFPHHLVIGDFSPKEKAAVLHYMVGADKRSFSDAKTGALAGRYAGMMGAGPDGGNARAVRNYYERLKLAQASRLRRSGDWSKEALLTFTTEDVKSAAASLELPSPAKMTKQPKSPAAGQANRQAAARRVASRHVVEKPAVAGGGTIRARSVIGTAGHGGSRVPSRS
jgi:stage V sporulation protein K